MREGTIQIGFGRADITPQMSLPLGGYGNAAKRMSTNVRDPMYATCIALTDEDGETVLLFTVDIISSTPTLTEQVRRQIHEAYGIPESHIMHAGTHSHSTPAVSMTEREDICQYRDYYADQFVAAAGQALTDRKPASIYIGQTRTHRMNFVRHYKMNDGTYAGSNFGDWGSGIAGHTSEPDNQIQLIKIERQGAKNILLMNWQAHPCLTSGMDATDISADYIGEVRKYLEEQTGCHFAFFLGAAGNLNVRSLIKGEEFSRDPVIYGKSLGEHVLEAMQNLRPVEGGTIEVLSRTITCPTDHSDDHLVPQAEKIQQYWQATYDKPGAKEMGRPYGINSPYAAGAIIRRSKREGSVQMTIYAVRVGELSFVCAPYEMFAVNGMYVKEHTPFPMTFVLSCCNDAKGYLASKFAFAHGCYEKDIRVFPEGTAEMIADNFVEMLGQLQEKA